MNSQDIESIEEESYYAVIFTAKRKEIALGYEEMAEKMHLLSQMQPGYIGIEVTGDAIGNEITVSYWKSLEAIKAWKANEEHALAQTAGRNSWYENYHIRICRVVREYNWHNNEI